MVWGAGAVQLADDNPYLGIEALSGELSEAELAVLPTTIAAMQALLPVLRRQRESRIAAKGALNRFTNAAAIELVGDGIYVTDIRPGGVDTGICDGSVVRRTISTARASYGCLGPLRLIPPLNVGETIAHTLASGSHVTAVNLVVRGQMPHTAS